MYVERLVDHRPVDDHRDPRAVAHALHARPLALAALDVLCAPEPGHVFPRRVLCEPVQPPALVQRDALAAPAPGRPAVGVAVRRGLGAEPYRNRLAVVTLAV